METKTIKIIDLLIKIANGEEVPKKIRLERIWRVSLTYNKEAQDYYYENNENGFFTDYFLPYNKDRFNLNEEVEIIEEEKEIRKLPNEIQEPRNFEEVVYIAEDLVRKINELIDPVNKLRKENK